ncbi:MAG: XdhC family protein [Pseudoxanthomonas sp.]
MSADDRETAAMAQVHRRVMQAARDAARDGDAATLAIVVETEGSTYARRGAMALFGVRCGQVGWLSGGCLEPEIALRAHAAAESGQVDWMDIDTRDDEDLLSGSAVGCRGRLHLMLLPLSAVPGWEAVVQAWWQAQPLSLGIRLAADATQVTLDAGDRQWTLACRGTATASRFAFTLAPPPTLTVFGGGPETPFLLPLLRDAGWVTALVERRARWLPQPLHAHAADTLQQQAPSTVVAGWQARVPDAVLVMHHNFELDRETLELLAGTPVRFIGLLGPSRRREDLFKLLPIAAREALTPRLRSPVGLDLGGQGAEAISLSIAAQLQAWRHGRDA